MQSRDCGVILSNPKLSSLQTREIVRSTSRTDEHFLSRAFGLESLASSSAATAQSQRDELLIRRLTDTLPLSLSSSLLSPSPLSPPNLLVRDARDRVTILGNGSALTRPASLATVLLRFARRVPVLWIPIPSDCSRIATGTLRCAEAVRPLRRCTKRTRSVRASPSRRSTTPWARTATRKSGPAAEPSLPITSSIRTTRHLRPTRASTVCNIFTSLSLSLSFSLSLSLFLYFFLFLFLFFSLLFSGV